ncbi:hypothetical protein MMC25_004564 [Agyrium rufum]|nr:hypothetical protein [Agyrium rufum]
MSTESIPQVTQEDLLTFHLKVYGTPFPGKPLNGWTENGAHNPASGENLNEDEVGGKEEEDNDLGYYDDGVKRTLTDEQISIFRHSEVQALLRERRLEEAQKAAQDEYDDDSNVIIDVTMAVEEQEDAHIVLEHSNGQRQEGPKDEGEIEDDDEEEYQKFLLAEEADFEQPARKKQKPTTTDGDRTRSMRRRVRELDEVTDSTAVLDYGDDEPVANASKEHTLAPERKTFLWPTLAA